MPSSLPSFPTPWSCNIEANEVTELMPPSLLVVKGASLAEVHDANARTSLQLSYRPAGSKEDVEVIVASFFKNRTDCVKFDSLKLLPEQAYSFAVLGPNVDLFGHLFPLPDDHESIQDGESGPAIAGEKGAQVSEEKEKPKPRKVTSKPLAPSESTGSVTRARAKTTKAPATKATKTAKTTKESSKPASPGGPSKPRTAPSAAKKRKASEKEDDA